MDNNLSAIGAYDGAFNNITSDNIFVHSSLHFSGIDILTSLSTINSSLNSMNNLFVPQHQV